MSTNTCTLVGASIDTWIINIKGDLSTDRAEELDALKWASQEADEDVLTAWVVCWANPC